MTFVARPHWCYWSIHATRIFENGYASPADVDTLISELIISLLSLRTDNAANNKLALGFPSNHKVLAVIAVFLTSEEDSDSFVIRPEHKLVINFLNL